MNSSGISPRSRNAARLGKKHGGIVARLLLLTISLLAFLTACIVSLNLWARNTIIENANDSANKLLVQTQGVIEKFYDDMENVLISMAYSPTTREYLLGDTLDRMLQRKSLNNVFSNTMLLQENIEGIMLFDASGQEIMRFGIRPGVTITYREASGMAFSPLCYNEKNNEPYYTISMQINDLDSYQFGKRIGQYCVVMNTDNYFALLSDSRLTARSISMLVDGDDQIVAYSGDSEPPAALAPDDDRFAAMSLTLGKTGWTLINRIPKSELLGNDDSILTLNIVAGVLSISLVAVFILAVWKTLIDPMNRIIRFVREYITKPEARLRLDSADEIGDLAAGINKMLDDISELNHIINKKENEKLQVELSRRQAVIVAYRSQINPHFLYNTLECIASIANCYDVPHIEQIASALSDMFRYTIKGNDVVPLEEEIGQIKRYATIIHARFMDKISIDFDLQQSALTYPVARMCLQPIVENAVFHGLERKKSGGRVLVRVWLESGDAQDGTALCFEVKDDGIGIPADQLEQVRQRIENEQIDSPSEQGIGMVNVYNRLKLLYGDGFVFHIDSAAGEGTRVTVKCNVDRG